MPRISTTQARKDFAAAINRAAYGKERLVLHRRGKDLAAMIPVEDLALLEQLEELVDIEEARAALADPKNRRRIPWQKVKANLGL